MWLLLVGCSHRAAPVDDRPADTDPVEETDTMPPVLQDPAPVGAQEVANGFGQVTDIAFPPGRSDVALVLSKTGEARWWNVADGTSGVLFTLSVPTNSELGLLGAAFHPDFQHNGKFYLNYNQSGPTRTVIAEWQVPAGHDLRTVHPVELRRLLEFDQPYDNHDGGCLRFGPDGMLYIGTGDGGSGGDPHGNGQNTNVLLGKMLRIDVNGTQGALQYRVPADNPFVGQAGHREEIWATGLRNPWRYAFAPDGRLVVADVGQDRFEEVSIVERGKNYGWNVREGFHCYPSGTSCPTEGLTDPIFEYGRGQGVSITGGYVYRGASVPSLKGWYVFSDYGSGRVWALALPDGPVTADAMARTQEVGRFALNPSTFGEAADGELYVGDIATGRLFQLVPAQ